MSKMVYVNSHAQFPMIDAVDGTRFEAGEPKKVADNRWIAAQVDAGVLYYCDADGVAIVAKGAADTPAETQAKAADKDPMLTKEAVPALGGGVKSGTAT